MDADAAAAVRAPIPFLTEATRRNQPQLTDLALLERITLVAAHYARAAETDTLVSLLAALEQALPSVAEAIVLGLDRGWPKDKPLALSEAGDDALVKLFQKSTPASRSRLVGLSSRWGSRKLERYAGE